ncbi:hypothetical protein GBA52_028007 [Prunus armeniaca]|nr:hypothetical protein GBA52_028007 [Prunus armeniaca]
MAAQEGDSCEDDAMACRCLHSPSTDSTLPLHAATTLLTLLDDHRRTLAPAH